MMLLYYEVLVVWWIQFRFLLYDFFILSLQKMADYHVGCIVIIIIITNGGFERVLCYVLPPLVGLILVVVLLVVVVKCD